MDNFITTILHEGLDKLLSNELKMEVIEDDGAWHPREDDSNAGIILVGRNDYLRNEEPAFDYDNFSGWDEVEEWLRTEKGAVEVLPIYIYDHSGITINTTGFSCGWDSCQLGLYYTTAERFKEYMNDDLSAENIKKVLVHEIKIYDKYLSGEVYAYKITNKSGRTLEYAGSYYDFEEAKKEGEGVMKSYQVQYNDEILKLKRHMASIQELPFVTA